MSTGVPPARISSTRPGFCRSGLRCLFWSRGWEASSRICPGWLTDTFHYYGIIALIAVLGIIVTAAYVLRVVGQVFFGEFNEERFPNIAAIKLYDKIALVFLVFWLVLLGVYPRLMAPMIESAMKPVVSLLGGG